MMQLLAIAGGGALGALLRFWVSSGIYNLFGREFPYGTLAVNLIGSLLIGFLSIFLFERIASLEWRAALIIGFLGAFTTFSTFSLETLNLMYAGEQIKALLNIGMSVIFCLFATWLGMLGARLIQ